jgi:hypothetical protein
LNNNKEKHMKSSLRFFLLASCLFALAGPARAQWVQTTEPGFSGKNGCLLVSGSNLFAGTDSAGVFLTTNSGTSWSPMNTNLTERYVWALAVSPASGGTGGTNLFAGTSGWVFLSTNSGSSWSQTATGPGGVSAFAVSGANLYAGGGNGVYLSTNNGTSWKSVKSGLTNTSVRSLAVSDSNIFAGTLGGGVFLSTNNGTKWNAVNTNLTDGSVYALAFSGSNLFAGTGGGVFLSPDKGASWSSVSAGLESEGSVYALAVYGSNLFAGTWSGNVFLSTNNGTTWTSISSNLADMVRALAVLNGTLFAGTNNGVWRRPLSEVISTSVETGRVDLPAAFSLAQNYPNPFNPSTVIRYTIPGGGGSRNYEEGRKTSLTVYDILGREVAVLVNDAKQPGTYEVLFNASNLASGVYLYRLNAGSFVETRKLCLIR